MERKTKITAEDGRQDLTITREFDLPVDLLFRAHADPDLIEQWMGNKVLEFELRKHGGWHYEVRDDKGMVLFEAHGAIHDVVPNQKITRTFEMLNVPLGVQLEILEFEKLTDDTSKLTMHTILKSVEIRDKLLSMPFEYGINMAHKRLEEVLSKLK